MAYELASSISLGPENTGLTLKAQLTTTAGVNLGAPILTSFAEVEIGSGEYAWDYAGFPDGFRGGIKILNAADDSLLAFGMMNPQDAENLDVKVSSLSVVAFPVGAIAFTYTVTNSVTLVPLDGVRVWIATDAAETNVIWSGVTDAFGVARDVKNNLPRLNAGTYFFFRQKSNFTFSPVADPEDVS